MWWKSHSFFAPGLTKRSGPHRPMRRQASWNPLGEEGPAEREVSWPESRGWYNRGYEAGG